MTICIGKEVELVELRMNESTTLASCRQRKSNEDFMAGEVAANPLHHLALNIGSRDVSYTQLESYHETPSNI